MWKIRNPNTGNLNTFEMMPASFVDADGTTVYTIAIYCNSVYVVSLANDRPFSTRAFDADVAIAQTMLYAPELIK